jgi:methionyl-tRNA synthetase
MERKQLDAIVAASRSSDDAAAGSGSADTQNETSLATIGIEDFAKVELRVARIVAAEAVAGADKLLRLELDLGTEQRQVLSGIKAAYDPADLVGRLTVVVANLAPRKMKFGTSQGMVLAAGPGGADIFLISPDSGAEPGMLVR